MVMGWRIWEWEGLKVWERFNYIKYIGKGVLEGGNIRCKGNR